MSRVLHGLSILAIAALAQGCLPGRYLYYADDPAAAEELNATIPDGEGAEDGGAPRGPDAAAKGDAEAGAGPSKDGAAPPQAVDAGPGPAPTCAGGTAAEREPNGTLDVANTLAVGKTCGALALGDTDWFMIDFGAAGDLRLDFEADGDARLLIQSAGGGVALATGTGGGFNFGTQGRWNLRVVSDTGRVQAYTLVRR